MATRKTEHPVNGVRNPATKKPKITGVETSFQVTSEGYQENFDTKAAAMEQVSVLKKRAVKSQEPIKVSVKELVDGKPGKEVHKLNISEDYYK